MRILFLTNLLPYPLDNGGKIKTYSTLQSLKNGGHIIDLVCFNESNNVDKGYEAEVLKLCNSVHQVYLRLTTADNRAYMMKQALKSLFTKYSFGVYKYKSKEMNDVLKALTLKYKYELIYYDHLQLCIYKPLLTKMGVDCPSLLDEHNCEALIIKRNAESTQNIIKKLFLLTEYHKLYKFEVSNIKSVHKCIVLSKEDYSALRNMCKCEFEHKIIPIGVIDRGIKKEAESSDSCLNILFVGTLTWEPNNNGIVWFLKNVLPLIEKLKLNYRLYIVGKNPGDELSVLAKMHTNVILTGYVESVDEYYDKCHCMIVPLFIGSGQRVKIIEAFSKGMPVISTSVGAEGLEFIHNDTGLLANTPEEFAETIMAMRDIKLQKQIAINARNVYEKNYSPAAIQNNILQYLK